MDKHWLMGPLVALPMSAAAVAIAIALVMGSVATAEETTRQIASCSEAGGTFIGKSGEPTCEMR